LEKIKKYCLLGIGGIGMSSIAQYLMIKKFKVFGFDRFSTSITKMLENKGAKISFAESINNIPSSFNSSEVEIIYSAAINNNHPILSYFISNGYKITKRASFLADLVNNTESYAIAGTHGKTTTSAILTHIFKNNKFSFSSFVGGIMVSENTNFLNQGFEKSIVEADEFDRSFLKLNPFSACITSMDSDHLDIYKTNNSLKDAFLKFSKNVKGPLIIHDSLSIPGIKYGLSVKADYMIENFKLTSNGYIVDLSTPKKSFKNVFCKVFGSHNLENMLAAFAIADLAGCDSTKSIESLGSFQGIERRMRFYNFNNIIIVDDYAHHPTEIKAVYNSLREKYPGSFIEVVFQPHLYSRTKDFMDDFAIELSKFNRVKLMDIYPARETEIPGINSKKLLSKINCENYILNKENFNSNIENSNADIIAVLGAGNIGELIERFIKLKNL
tara:strand:- start:3609 stop:4934 length:1326 start_codon:yes stop_codon:yes gene_type:complete